MKSYKEGILKIIFVECKLHIALHGCLQHAKKIGDVYVRNAGYNEVADLNDFIILYPQATTSTSNPNGCWDWFVFLSISLFFVSSCLIPFLFLRWGYVNANYGNYYSFKRF